MLLESMSNLVPTTFSFTLPLPLQPRACRICIEEDEIELIINQLIEDILQKSQDVLFEKHISSQVLPYAVQFAKDAIIQVAKWEFFDEDRVDPNDPIWLPDEEPERIEPDSWARGIVSCEPIVDEDIKPTIPWNENLSPEYIQSVLSMYDLQPDIEGKSIKSSSKKTSQGSAIAKDSTRMPTEPKLSAKPKKGPSARPVRIWQP